LLQCGDEALPAVQEALAVTVFDDVKQTCIEAIGLLEREQKANKPPIIRSEQPVEPRNQKGHDK